MSISYNIYRMEYSKVNELVKKITSVGLIEQKSIGKKKYKMTSITRIMLKVIQYGGGKHFKIFLKMML
nr:hypothetical protein [Pectobacterium brasiliense]